MSFLILTIEYGIGNELLMRRMQRKTLVFPKEENAYLFMMILPFRYLELMYYYDKYYINGVIQVVPENDLVGLLRFERKSMAPEATRIPSYPTGPTRCTLQMKNG